MVSWLPWRGDSSSTASFEKTLSTLSTKITASQARLDKLRASSRRAQVLATLYLSLVYVVFAIVAFLVIGTNGLGQIEWAGVIMGPFLIFGVRKALSSVYNYRIESLSARLKDQQAERAKTIQKLKDATKYDSTLELIEKYGGSDGKSNHKGQNSGEQQEDEESTPKKQRHGAAGPMQGRTRMPPPPTANIQRQSPPTPDIYSQNSPRQVLPDPMEPTEEFAPNAGPPPLGQQTPSHHAQGYNPLPAPTYEPGHWYDRIFDVLLGEDETAAKNRIVLICHACRVVNGQAPPGTRSLAELGLWRCMSCGASNGAEKEDEGTRIVREVLSNGSQPIESAGPDLDDDGSNDHPTEAEMQTIDENIDDGPAASVRKRRVKGKK